MSKKIMVTAILFCFDAEKNNERSIDVCLNSGLDRAITITRGLGESLRFTTNAPDGKISNTELDRAMLVAKACATFILGGEQESMSYGECIAADNLSREFFDWKRAGYGEGSKDEKYMTLCDHIEHFYSIG